MARTVLWTAASVLLALVLVLRSYRLHTTTSMTADRPLCVATYNLRFDSMPDGLSVVESVAALPDALDAPRPYMHGSGTEARWSARRIRAARKVLARDVDVLCVQEALIRQIRDLLELLGDVWAWEGAGRDDGKEGGEFSAILYRKDRLHVESADHFWLSETPFEPSQHADAANIRIATAVRFALPGTHQRVAVLNSHLDHAGEGARRAGAALLLRRAQFEAARGAAVLLAGDFNSPPEGRDAGAYEIATGARAPGPLPADFAARFPLSGDGAALHDLRARAPKLAVRGGFATYTGWGGPATTREWARIDFVFGFGADWEVHDYEVDTSVDDDGVLASDHRPVFMHVSLREA